MDIREIGLSVRAFSCLVRAGINTTEKLVKTSDEELKNVRNLGLKCLEEVVTIKNELRRDIEIEELKKQKRRNKSMKITIEDALKAISERIETAERERDYWKREAVRLANILGEGQVTIEKVTKIARHYDKETQMRQAQEECAELIVAINKHLRATTEEKYKKSMKNLLEKCVDVDIIVAQIENRLSRVESVNEMTDKKLDEELRRVAEEENV